MQYRKEPKTTNDEIPDESPEEKAFQAAMEVLSDRHFRFVNLYMILQSGTKAALGAGYSEKTAGIQAAQLKKRPDIAKALAAGEARFRVACKKTLDDVEAEISRIAFTNVEGDLNHREKIQALALWGKMFGGITQKIAVEHTWEGYAADMDEKRTRDTHIKAARKAGGGRNLRLIEGSAVRHDEPQD